MSEFIGLIPSRHLEHDPSRFGLVLSGLWSALPKPSWFGLRPREHVSLEIIGEAAGVHLQIGVPRPAIRKIVAGQLAAHFPDVQFASREAVFPACTVWASAELGLALDRGKGLRTLKNSDPDPQAGIIASLSELAAGEFALVQILARPSLIAGLKGLSWEVVVRLCTGTCSEQRARSRLAHVTAAFGQFAAANAFRPLGTAISTRSVPWPIAQRHWPTIRLTPLILTIEELTSVYHLPAPSRVRSSYLEVTGARRLPPPREMPGAGIRVGVASRHGRVEDVRLSPDALLRHMALFGGTGTGKTTLLTNMGLDLAALGRGFTVIDPHRSLIPPLLRRIPEERLQDVILLRAEDLDFPVAIDLMRARPGFEFLTVDELVEIIRRIDTREYWGPRLDAALRHAAYAVLDVGGSLLDMARVLDDEQYRASVVPRVSNPGTRRYFQRLSSLREGAREQLVGPAANRLDRLATPLIRGIVGQRDPKLGLRQVMDEGKILLVDLAGIGDSNAQFLGSLMTLRFRQAALSRTDTPESKRRPHILLMDECSWFITNTIGRAMSDVRKFHLGLVLAAQHLSQLKPEEIRDSVFANLGSLIAFRMGERGDERYLEQAFGTAGLTADEIHSLDKYEIYARIMQKGERPPAFWARTPPPSPTIHDERVIEQVLERTRRLYARPRRLVEQEIASQEGLATDDEPERRPRRRRATTD